MVEVAFGSGQGPGGVGDLLLPLDELPFQLLLHCRQPHRFTPVHAGLNERDLAFEPGHDAVGFQPMQFPCSEFGLIHGE